MPRRVVNQTASAAPIIIGQATSAYLSAGLFGLGVDLNAATYSVRNCQPLPHASFSLVRIGAGIADDYDWQHDTYVSPYGGGSRAASFGCLPPGVKSPPAASILRVLARVYQQRANAVVVLNGESDDAQSAANLVRLIVNKYGLAFASQLYWEIGNAPAQWQHFAEPLNARSTRFSPCTPDQYSALVSSYAAAISTALAGATPQIIADEWIANATDQFWTGVVQAIDMQYFPFNTNSQFLTPPDTRRVARSVITNFSYGGTLDERLSNLRATLTQYSGGQNIDLFMGAWNIDANTNVLTASYDPAAKTVFVANLFLNLIENGVDMAAWAAPLYTGPQAPFSPAGDPTAAYRLFAALKELSGARVLSVQGAQPDSFLAVRQSNGRISVLAINTSVTRATTLSLQFAGLTAQAHATLHLFDASQSQSSRTVDPAHVTLSLPALSVALLTL